MVGALRALVVEGANVNAKEENDYSALAAAIIKEQRAAALYLINEAPGVDIEAPTWRGDTPLIRAAGRGAVNVLRALVAKGANVNAKTDENDFSALHVAVLQEQRAAALFLVNEAPGVDIDSLDAYKQTPLTLAAVYGDVTVMKALVTKGANVNAKNVVGSMALSTAISKGHEEAAIYLIEEAAAAVYDPDAPASAGVGLRGRLLPVPRNARHLAAAACRWAGQRDGGGGDGGSSNLRNRDEEDGVAESARRGRIGCGSDDFSGKGWG